MSEDHDTTGIEYRTIARFPNYRFSSDGQVQTSHRGGQPGGTWTTLQGNSDERGRIRVDLRELARNRAKHYFVSNLILEAFVGPCPPGLQACHFPDPNVKNNAIWNLRWDTSKSNHADRLIHGTDARGEKSVCAKVTQAQVEEMRQVRADGATVKALAYHYGISEPTVSAICVGRLWKHAGGPRTKRGHWEN